jgi:hypothetical protein
MRRRFHTARAVALFSILAPVLLLASSASAWDAGWYGFNCAGISCNTELELQARCPSPFTRLPFRIVGATKNDLCAALGLVCVGGCAWDGGPARCDTSLDGGPDGTQIAFCSVPTVTPTAATPRPTATPTPSPTATPILCVGDCNHDGSVAVDDALSMVDVILGPVALDQCLAGDPNGDGEVTVDELLIAVQDALGACAPLPPAAVPAVHGTVRMPEGLVAQAPGSFFEKCTALFANRALALSAPSVRPVGAGVEVKLRRYGSGEVLVRALTDDQGRFRVAIPLDVDAQACPWLTVSVGSGSTLTRAFVYSLAEAVDIDFASEAGVRVLEDAVQADPRFQICLYPGDMFGRLRQLVQVIRSEPDVLLGDTPGEINLEAARLAEQSDRVREVLGLASPD